MSDTLRVTGAVLLIGLGTIVVGLVAVGLGLQVVRLAIGGLLWAF